MDLVCVNGRGGGRETFLTSKTLSPNHGSTLRIIPVEKESDGAPSQGGAHESVDDVLMSQVCGLCCGQGRRAVDHECRSLGRSAEAGNICGLLRNFDKEPPTMMGVDIGRSMECCLDAGGVRRKVYGQLDGTQKIVTGR